MSTPIIDLYVPVTVSSEDKSKYGRVMSNWTYLSTYLCASNPDAQVVGTLIRVELDGKSRKPILDRLVARLGSCVRLQLKKELDELYERKSS